MTIQVANIVKPAASLVISSAILFAHLAVAENKQQVNQGASDQYSDSRSSSAVPAGHRHNKDNSNTSGQTWETTIEQVLVTGYFDDSLSGGTGSAADRLSKQGVDFSSAGGISSLPVIRGLNDDRIKLLIDGAETTSACANHMNPALSYIDTSRIQTVDIFAGITPVSAGGDSIGGTIVITSDRPEYAEGAESLLTSGSGAYFYRSGKQNHGVSLKATLADNRTSLSYSGSYDESESYRDGNGNKVLDTLYKSESHNLTLGMRDNMQSITLKLGHQKVPYQGFPNQYMDMEDNISNTFSLNYLRKFSWGQLDNRIYWQDVNHDMGFFTDEKPGSMPMKTEGKDLGYKIAATIPYGEVSMLRIGNEYHQFELDDWWPAVPGSMMMGPDDFVNINEGERSRYALYAESENNIGEQWQMLAGMRYEKVVTDTGDVQPYSTMSGMMSMNLDAPAADTFNIGDRRRHDDNIDVTVLTRFIVNNYRSIEFGYARKNRSPNLYERYSWGRGTMAMTMIGWFGDGNGYVGDIDLSPEIAHTFGLTYKWLKDDSNQLLISPFYTYVDDYIDVRQIDSFNPRQEMMVTRPLLQFINIDAKLYGLEVKMRKQLLRNYDHLLVLDTRLAYTKGERRNDGGDLYHIMPLNAKLALEHATSRWTSRLELEWVDRKENVDDLRLESETSDYTLANISTEYGWGQVTIKAGVSNVFDRNYELPLGGVYLAGWLASDRMQQFENLPGEGRSLNIGVIYEF